MDLEHFMHCLSGCFGSPVDYFEWTCITQASVGVPRKWAGRTGIGTEPAHVTAAQPGRHDPSMGEDPQWVSAGSRGSLPVRVLGEHSTPSSLGSHESWFKRPTPLLVPSIVLLPV